MAFELARAFVSVTTNIGQMTSGLNQGEAALRSSVSRMQSSLNNLGGTVNSILALFGMSAGVMGLYSIGKQLIFATDATEKLKNSLTTMLKGNAAQADMLVAKMKEFAALTPFTEEMVSSAVTQFLPFSKNMDELFETIKSIGDAAAVSSRGLAAFPRVALAMSQMMGKGKISGEEMRQLTEAGITGWEVLSRAMGKNVAQVQAMAAKNELRGDAINKFIKQMGKEFTGSMEKQSKSVEGLWSTISDNIKVKSVEAFKPFYTAIQGIMAKIADFVQTDRFTEMMQTIGDAMKTALEWIGTAWEYISDIWGKLSPQFKIAVVAASLIGPAFAIAVPIVTTLFGMLTGVLPIIGAIGAAVWAGTMVWKYFGDEIMAVVHWVMVFASNWEATWEIVQKAARVAITWMKEWFGNFFTTLLDRWDKLIAAWIDVMLLGATTLVDVLIAAFGAVDWGALGEAMLNVVKNWMAAMEGFGGGLVKIFLYIVDNWRDIMLTMLDILKNTLEAMPELWTTALKAMFSGDTIGTAMVKGFKAASEKVKAAAGGAAGLAGTMGEQFQQGFNLQYEASRQRYGATQGMGEALGTIGDQAWNAASAAADAAMANISEKVAALNHELALLSTFEESDQLKAMRTELSGMITDLEAEYNRQAAAKAMAEEEKKKSKVSGEFDREKKEGLAGPSSNAFVGFAEFNRKMQEALMNNKPLEVASKQLDVQRGMHRTLEEININMAGMAARPQSGGVMTPEFVFVG